MVYVSPISVYHLLCNASLRRLLAHVAYLSTPALPFAAFTDLVSVMRPVGLFSASCFSQLLSMVLRIGDGDGEAHVAFEGPPLVQLFPSAAAFPLLRSLQVDSPQVECGLSAADAMARLPKLDSLRVAALISENAVLALLQLPSLRLLDLTDSQPYHCRRGVLASDAALYSACEVLRLPSDRTHVWVAQLLQRLTHSLCAPQLHSLTIATEASDFILNAALRIPTIRKLHVHLLPGDHMTAMPVAPPVSHIRGVHLTVHAVERAELDVVALFTSQLRSFVVQVVEDSRIGDNMRVQLLVRLAACKELRVCEMRHAMPAMQIPLLRWGNMRRLSVVNADLSSAMTAGLLVSCPALVDIEVSCHSLHVATLLSWLCQWCRQLQRLHLLACRVQSQVHPPDTETLWASMPSTAWLPHITQLRLEWDDAPAVTEQLDDSYFAMLAAILRGAPLTSLSLGMRYQPSVMRLLMASPHLEWLGMCEQQAVSAAASPPHEQAAWDVESPDDEAKEATSTAAGQACSGGRQLLPVGRASCQPWWPALHSIALGFNFDSHRMRELQPLLSNCPHLTTLQLHIYGDNHAVGAVRSLILVGRYAAQVSSLAIHSHEPSLRRQRPSKSDMARMIAKARLLPASSFSELRSLRIEFDTSRYHAMSSDAWRDLRDSEWMRQAPLTSFNEPVVWSGEHQSRTEQRARKQQKRTELRVQRARPPQSPDTCCCFGG